MWLMHPFLYNWKFHAGAQRYTTVPTARDARKSALMSMWLGTYFFPLLLVLAADDQPGGVRRHPDGQARH